MPSLDGLRYQRAHHEREHILPAPRRGGITIGADVSMVSMDVIGLECGIEREGEQKPRPEKCEGTRAAVSELVRDGDSGQPVEVPDCDDADERGGSVRRPRFRL